jgi:hypothetical protein
LGRILESKIIEEKLAMPVRLDKYAAADVTRRAAA